MCVCAQLCPTLCDPMDYSPPSSSVHGIFQARILERIADPGIESASLAPPALAGRFFTTMSLHSIAKQLPLISSLFWEVCMNVKGYLFLALTFYSLCNVHISGLFSGYMSGHGSPNVEYCMVYSHIIGRVAGKIQYPS